MKHLRVLTNGGMHLDFVNQIKRDVASCDLMICNKNSIEDIESKIMYKPMFSSKIILEFYADNIDRVMIKLLRRYMNLYPYVQLIIICSRNADYKKLEPMVNEKLMLSFNIYLVNEDYVKNYISTRLRDGRNLSSHVDALYRRVKGNLGLIDDYINIVNSYEGKVTVQRINLILPLASSINIDKVFMNIIMRRDFKGTMKYVNRFRVGHRWMRKELLEKFDDLIRYQIKFAEGEFNKLNIKEFISEKENRDIGGKLYGFLAVYESCSFDWIYSLYMRLLELPVNALQLELFIIKQYNGPTVGPTISRRRKTV